MSKEFSKEQIKINPFDPLNNSRETWNLYHEYHTTLHNQRFPDIPLTTSDKNVEKSLKLFMEHPQIDPVYFSIMDTIAQKQIGDILCSIPSKGSETYEENPNYMEFYINILEGYYRKGIGTSALAKVRDVALEHEKTLLATDTHYQTGKAFLQALGAELEIGIENRLQLEDVDWSMVEQWENEGQEHSPQTSLVQLDSIPEDIIEQFNKVYTEIHNQQPWEDLEEVAIKFSPEFFRHRVRVFKETGALWVVFLTMEEDGKISGLTEMIYGPSFRKLITQELTGVKQEYRGRGLGKWLKAAMLLKIKEDFPEVTTIRTENATTNAPMLYINERLGFKFFRESIEAHITLEKLNQYLKSKE
ncbi:MAG: GNAT family N-acetyltransferase [Candidatus Heimdallarchaeota archaeon]|nr:GNAT family N-acetyltransferase [Candidatus Heimdallarchaeota archaeon]MCK4876258.1 GNAT family N-acetyltransferase [Candidatus Heimdallarchaeota archaeon]